MGFLSTLCLSAMNPGPAIRTEQPTMRMVMEALSFWQGLAGIDRSSERFMGAAAIGPWPIHRPSSSGFIVLEQSMASVVIMLQDIPRKMASLPASTATAICGFSLLLLFACFLKGRAGQWQGKNSNLRPLLVPPDGEEISLTMFLDRVLSNLVVNISKQLHDFVKEHPSEPVDFKRFFQNKLFALLLKQALGEEVKSVYIEEFGATLSKDVIFKVLVLDMMHSAIEAVTKALIKEQKKRIAAGKDLDSYTDF
ncbi:hypothetical protein MLD38_012935 [Melastoma candidum]|uniref:Uncharacterized protein n=1 Tax=Melastoma candidum TaxID=119954 RepID=A0ACB9R842_9MYRT|nr:hypothetical protein MLD38_012935 [Melastoma candidum]